MAIPVQCVCGRSMRVKDEFAGRRARCPSCNFALQVPARTNEMKEIVLDVVPVEDDEPRRGSRYDEEPKGRSRRPALRDEDDSPYVVKRTRDEIDELEEPSPRRARLRPTEEDDDVPDVRKRSRRTRDDDDDDSDTRPRRRRRRMSKERGSTFGTSAAGVLGGIGMMLLAVVWFVGGLYINRIFFYPPILFVVGIGAVINGLRGE